MLMLEVKWLNRIFYVKWPWKKRLCWRQISTIKPDNVAAFFMVNFLKKITFFVTIDAAFFVVIFKIKLTAQKSALTTTFLRSFFNLKLTSFCQHRCRHFRSIFHGKIDCPKVGLYSEKINRIRRWNCNLFINILAAFFSVISLSIINFNLLHHAA